jgi:hypothetical protein
MALIITYEKLKQILTESEGFDYVLQLAKMFKLPTTSFLSGSIGYTILKVQGAILAIISDSVSEISKQIYLDTATGEYLTLLASNFFDYTRYPETQTIILPRIATVGATPASYDAESVKIQISGIEFYNTNNFTILADGYLDVSFSSTEYGADTRVATNVLPVFTQNIIANATFSLISNDDGYFSVIENGQDVETDIDLRERCRSKWALLSTLGPEDAYKNWILNTINTNTGAPVDITRIKIDKSTAQSIGNLVIYCASDTGAASAEDLGFVDAVVQKNRCINATVFVDPAIESTFLYSLTVTVNSSAEPDLDLLTASVMKCISDYFTSIDIGGVILVAEDNGYVIYQKIADTIMELPGVENVVCTSLEVDNVLQTNNDVQISINTVPVINATSQYAAINIVRI